MILTGLHVALFALASQQLVMGLSLPSTHLSPADQATLHNLDTRETKFLSTFITIRNVACDSKAGTACLTKQDCAAQRGTASGLCLLGLGVCCHVTAPVTTTTAAPNICGGTATGRSTRFSNPAFPTSYSTPGTCRLSVPLLDKNICQLMINFTTFHLSQPDLNGKCATDYFKVSGSANDANIPKLCGDNDGRHVYVDVDPALGAPVIRMYLEGSGSARTWDFNITQISCNDTKRAPAGCLQYYTEQSGTIESFNYKKGLTAIGDVNTHLAKMDYGSCIASAGYCKVTYKRTDDSKYAFLMSGNTDAIKDFDVAPDAVLNLLITHECKSDYVVIPQASYSPVVNTTEIGDRFCGLSFPSEVTSTAAPFVLYVRTNKKEITDDDANNNGFSLDFMLSEEC